MILSVSRRTDIPKYYFNWFCDRLNDGQIFVRNPMNQKQVSKVLLNEETVDCIAFWTKDATPMINNLDRLKNYPFFMQFTINPYGKDIETNLPEKINLFNSFKILSKQIGKDLMIWRYSPILYTDFYNLDFHIREFEKSCIELEGLTTDCRISFLDMYSKIKRQMSILKVRELTTEEQKYIVSSFITIGEKYGINVSGCGNMDLKEVGLEEKACIDKDFVERAISRSIIKKKDSGQRDTCYCMPSVDIGSYNTCLNGCKYCYANWSLPSISNKIKLFDIKSDILCDTHKESDKITIRKMPKLK